MALASIKPAHRSASTPARSLPRLIALLALCGVASAVHAQTPITSAFTYQGELSSGGSPVNGTFDLRFRLFDAVSAGTQVGPTLCVNNVAVTNGRFVAVLDFSASFTRFARFLEIEVRTDAGQDCAVGGAYTLLTPRQEFKATPQASYALGALSAENAANATFASNASTAANAVNASNAVNATNASQLNNQSALFYQNASNLNSGTLPDARLGGTYAGVLNFSNASNTYSGNGSNLTGLWRIGGNGGTTPAVNFVGTTDNQPLHLRVFNRRASALTPTQSAITPLSNDDYYAVNINNGADTNLITAGVDGATIAGGGLNTFNNAGTVATYRNTISADWATITGGVGNNVNLGASGSTVGGMLNVASGFSATISGGFQNTASQFSVVGGGRNHQATGSFATVAGGEANVASGNHSTVAGGILNQSTAPASSVGGGDANAATGAYSTIAGGRLNSTTGGYAFVGGGESNSADASDSVVVGGFNNGTTGNGAFVGAGVGNIASGTNSFVAAGNGNAAQGVNSVAMGTSATAAHPYTFVWNDGAFGTAATTGPDQFLIFANGGVGINTGAPGARLDVRGPATSRVNIFTGDLAPFGAAGYEANFSAAGIGPNSLLYLAKDNAPQFFVSSNGSGFLNGQLSLADQIGVDPVGSNTNEPEVRIAAAFSDPVGISVENANSYSIVNLDNNSRLEFRTTSVRGGMVRIDGRDATFGQPLFQFWHRAPFTGAENLAASIGTNGNLTAAGTITGAAKFFQIDHPSDPANKTLRHACIESDEYKNVYDGIAITDDAGYATIQLPSWMNDLNEKFRYQLTVIDEADTGDPLLWARVTRKIDSSNSFVIRTSGPGVEVSWQVTGVRKDAWAKANPFAVEEAKQGTEQGKYLAPEAFGKAHAEGIFSGEAMQAKADAANAPARQAMPQDQ
jgi:hypothetical protein